MRKMYDITGQRFGRLTVISRAPNNESGNARWNCVCQCGSSIVVQGSHLRALTTRSCGCLQKEVASELTASHRMTDTRVYRIWRGMKDRCMNKNSKDYVRYGERGIFVCSRWVGSFELFYSDMGDPPTSEHSIERQDNNKGYTPCNCYWAGIYQQANNMRSNRYITYGGRTLTFTQWGRHLNGSKNLVSERIGCGWTEQQAVATPVGAKRV